VAFKLSNGTLITQPSTAVEGSFAVPDFFGVTANSTFQSVLLTSPDMALNLDNVSFVSSVPSVAAPEPGTWPVLTGCLACLAAGLRRKRRNV
jgi:hypothetical protein